MLARRTTLAHWGAIVIVDLWPGVAGILVVVLAYLLDRIGAVR